MSEQAQRIVTSHKEAAKRATEYLARARNLKLKQAEALELVAQVLGVANWQTLNAMAQQGRAPRLDVGDTPAQEAVVVSAAPDATVKDNHTRGAESMAGRLAVYYYERGYSEHPMFSREDWPGDVDVPGTEDLEYWGFVLRRLTHIRALFPWDRGHIAQIALCEAAGIDVDFDFNNERWVVASSELDEFLDHDGDPSELGLWSQLAKEVEARTKKLQGISEKHWHSMHTEARCSAATAAFGVRSYRKPPEAATGVTRDFLLQFGFSTEFRPGEKMPYLVQKLPTWSMPYMREHAIKTGEVSEGGIAVLEVTPQGMLVFSIPEDDYREDPVSMTSEDAKGVFRDAGVPI